MQTLYDIIFDALNGNYTQPAPKTSFTNDILPLLRQFTENQWVNQGFYVGFGYRQGFDFYEPELVRRLGTLTDGDIYKEYRRQIFNYFRPPNPTTIQPQLWPWMYGDNMNVPATTPNGYFSITNTLYTYLTQWANGDFIADWDPNQSAPAFDELDPEAQAEMLTKSALWYCVNTKLPREQRLEAFNRRASWYRILGKSYLDSIQNMVDRYGDMGVVEWRPGVKNAGILAALYSGVKAANALLSGGLDAYSAAMTSLWDAFFVNQKAVYSVETRWRTPFWARRL